MSKFSICQFVDHVNFLPFTLMQEMICDAPPSILRYERIHIGSQIHFFLRLQLVTVLTLKYAIVARPDKVRLIWLKHFLKKKLKNLLKINVLICLRADNGAIKRLCLLLGRSHALRTYIP